MRAMQIEGAGLPLRARAVPVPQPAGAQLLLKVQACGICRTDLHLMDGDLAAPRLPLTPGHEIVGTVVARGAAATRFAPGQRVGVPWLAWTCGECDQCAAGRENLCASARFTGCHVDGGFAEYALADERYCLALPDTVSAAAAAPLLCAGLIGYRAWRAAGPARRLGLYGFGAAAHLLAQLARHQGQEVYAFTRAGDGASQAHARTLGAVWAGDSTQAPPQPLDAALIFAPVGALVPLALQAVAPGGTVVCAGIHMSDLPAMPYALLWGERTLRSVANLTRRDGEEFLALAGSARLQAEVREFALGEANEAIRQLRVGAIQGAAVLRP